MATPRNLGELPVATWPKENERFGVLDLGAGSFHLTLAEVGRRGQVRRAHTERRPVRMVEPLRTGHLDDASWGVGRGTLGSLVAAARREADTTLLAVASSWFGELDNGPEFLAEARGSSGLPIELLTGEEEARLVWSAARAQAPFARGPVAVVSIGASSVLLAVGLGEMCLYAASLPLGALRMRARCLGAGSALDGEAARAIAEVVLETADGAAKELRGFGPAYLLLAGGTCRTLGRACRVLPEGPAAPVLCHQDALSLVALLSGRGAEALAAQRLGPDRADCLGPAAVVLSSLLALLGIGGGIIVRAGLREGVLLRERTGGEEARAHDERQ